MGDRDLAGMGLLTQGSFDAGQKPIGIRGVLLTEFDQKRSLDMCGAGAAHDCDSEEGRALQDIFFSSLLIVILV